METYVSLPKSAVQVLKDISPALTWQTLIAVLIFSCLATRIITGLRSWPKKVPEGEPHPVRKLPYWIPFIGHSLSYLSDQRNFVAKAGSVVSLPHSDARKEKEKTKEENI
jgi:hypothetical protein